ncbi:hypothetical protein [Cupriavidus sp. TMH.W2]|uniref:hypothetical protein n=1 Tax=Cupriavidus sp. TMH.W2 TaxID=3434465 RepID=UPI003D77421B
MTTDLLLNLLTPPQLEAITRADAILARAQLPSFASMYALLASARSHVAAPAEGHDDVLLAIELLDQIDFVLAAVPVPGATSGAPPALH